MLEWVSARDAVPEYAEEPDEFTDGFGNGNDGPALLIGSGAGGAVLEGTREELRAWLKAALDLIPEGD